MAPWKMHTHIDVSVNNFIVVGFGDDDAVDCGGCVGHGGASEVSARVGVSSVRAWVR